MNEARYSYLSRICSLIAQGEDIVIVSCDYAAPVLDQFRIDYPERYVSVGIAEQNLIAVSCGLALAGKRAIAYGCAPFPVIRPFDQIKNAASMMNLPISIVLSGIGFMTPEWGATHYNAEDIALMRTIPNMRIITPTDKTMGAAAADYALVNTTPVYVRFDKFTETEIYNDREIDFHKGFEVLREGEDVAVITCGAFTSHSLKLAEEWQKERVSARVIDLYSIPFDASALLSAIGNTSVLTIEEHILAGGIGSMVLEIINEHGMTNAVRRIGIHFDGGYPQTSGSRGYYLEKCGLSDREITKAAFALAK